MKNDESIKAEAVIDLMGIAFKAGFDACGVCPPDVLKHYPGKAMGAAWDLWIEEVLLGPRNTRGHETTPKKKAKKKSLKTKGLKAKKSRRIPSRGKETS
jgi:hypothetical protein